MKVRSCSTCEFFVPYTPDKKKGECRESPPSVFMQMTQVGTLEKKFQPVFFNRLPTVDDIFWCGAYEWKDQ